MYSTGALEVFKLGVVKMTGKHTAALLEDHIKNRLSEFGLVVSDIQSMTTDSGANIKKAGVDLERGHQISWAPCILHSLHNSIKYGLGLTEEKEKAELIDDDMLGDLDGLFVQAHGDGEAAW